MKFPPIIQELMRSFNLAIHELEEKVTDLRLAPYEDGMKFETILFTINGHRYRAELKGRNKDIVPCMGHPEVDRAIAIRCLVDGHAKTIGRIRE